MKTTASADEMGANDNKISLARKLGLRQGQLPLLIFAVVIICITAKVLWPSGSGFGISLLDSTPELKPIQDSQKYDKWIVVTTIQSPTVPVKKLAQMPGWRMVVVGDKKTPKDWSVPGVIYLSPEIQETLPYTLVKMIPYKSYSRKNIGYLYAIQHGAQVIYETDDDNLAEDGLQGFKLDQFSWSMLIETNNLTYNPYVHFGQSTTWPRGYPLEYLPLPTPHKYKLCKMPTASVQQGVVNGDPDLDATFRLTRKNSFRRIDISFDLKAPSVVLPVNTYSPYNCQDTLVTYNGFWSLLLPLSKNMRTLDIYRGYIAEKLMWLIGQRLEFIATDTYQKRNVHSYIKDATDEIEFLQMGKFVDVLNNWTCRKSNFFACVEEAYELAKDTGYYNQLDVDSAKAWLNDLARIGYKPPSLNNVKDICVEVHDKESVYYYGEEQYTTMFHTPDKFVPPSTTGKALIESHLTNTCSGKSTALRFSPKSKTIQNKLLIVDVADNYNVIPLLDAWYRQQISQILYCGNGISGIEQFASKWMVSIIAPPDGRVSSMSGCLYLATKMAYKVQGIIYIQKDMLFTNGGLSNLADNVKMTQNIIKSIYPCTLDCLPISKEDIQNFGSLKPNLPEFRQSDQDNIMGCAKRFVNRFTKEALFQHTMAYYLPLQDNIKVPIMRFAEAYLQKFSAQVADIFTAVISTCIDPNNSPLMYSSFQQKLSVDYIHPFNLEQLPYNASHLSFYCANVQH